MKRILIVVVALFAGALPAVVMGATSKSSKAKTTSTKSTTTLGTIGGSTVLGATKTPISSPVCPPDPAKNGCNIVLTRATALETIRDGIDYPTTVKKAGELVAFTVGLAAIAGTSQETPHQEIHNLDTKFGGVTLAGITVLKGGKGTAGSRPWTVAAVSPVEHLQPFLGYTVQFPLATPIQVTPGETVGLTVPTWAPVLTYLLNKKNFAYRQSRKTNCSNAGAFQNAQIRIGQVTPYKCDYPGTRAEYSVTEVYAAPAPKHYVHSKRQPR